MDHLDHEVGNGVNNAAPEGENNSTPVSERAVIEQKNLRLFVIGIAGFLGIAIILSLLIGIYRVYAVAANDSFTKTVATALQLPAAKVNGQKILYSSYLEDLNAIRRMRDYDAKNGGQGAALTDEQMSDQVLWRLTNNILIDEAAKKFNVSVSADEVNTLKSQLISQFPNEEAVNKELTDRYGWTLAEYEKKVMRPYVLQSKVAEKVDGDVDGRANARNQAEKVLAEIKDGADFAEAAKKYGQDGTAENGGDLGWFAKADMVPEFSDAAFALEKGKITDELVETQYGYHIIKLEDKKVEKEKDENGKDVNVEKVSAKHILFRFPNISDYMDARAKEASIHMYLKVHNPFEELKK